MSVKSSSFKLIADLVPLFRGLVSGLQPYALAQDVTLSFKTFTDSMPVSYNPEEALLEITTLVSRVVTFTPQTNAVVVSIQQCKNLKGHYTLCVENTGVDLSKIGEILSAVKNGLKVVKLEQGTQFIVTIPTRTNHSLRLNFNSNNEILPKQYPMYFTEISKRLSTYFSSTENLEEIAELKSMKEGVFLKKVNAIINSHISNPEFKVDNLAYSVALSRTQLFRKIKALTQMSPQQYLRFVRLEKAKRLLQTKEKNFNVSEVCYEVGFASKSHFTRSFKKAFGFNPSDLRNKKV